MNSKYNARLILMGISTAVAVLTAVSAFASMDRGATLKPNAETWSQQVCIGDIVQDAWLKGRCSVDKKNCCKWNMGGQLTATFSRYELQRALDTTDFGGVRVVLNQNGPSEVTVTQTKRMISGAEIKNRIVEAMNTKFPGDVSSVTALHSSMPIHVGIDAAEAWDVAIPDPITERAMIRVVSLKDGPMTIGWVNANLSRKAKVYTAKKTIAPMQKVSVEDFELKSTEVIGIQASEDAAYTQDRFPAGVRSRVTIRPGMALSSKMIEREPLVKLGDMVTLVLRSDNMKIATKGVVQSGGAAGDTVTVQLHRYNRAFRGKLQDDRSVEVWF